MTISSFELRKFAMLFAITLVALNPRALARATQKIEPLDVKFPAFEIRNETLPDGLWKLARGPVPFGFGFEKVLKQKLSDSEAPDPRINLKLQDKSIREILDALCKADPHYTWAADGAMVDVFPRAAAEDSTYLLNRTLPRFDLKNATDVQNGLLAIVWQLPPPIEQIAQAQAGGDDPYPPEPWSISLENVTVRHVINRLAEHGGPYGIWIFGGAKDFQTFGFFNTHPSPWLSSPDDEPALNAVEPSSAVTTPGTKVLVYGQSLLPDAIIYFDGLEARQTTFVSPVTLEVVTPYLRPGVHKLQLKVKKSVIQSEVTFTALPASVDEEFDRVLKPTATAKALTDSIEILRNIARGNADFQVRAFAHYQASLLYFAEGDWWHWAAEASSIFDQAERSGAAVQTCWRYRLSLAQSDYLLPTGGDAKHDLVMAKWIVEKDVTQDPEPRFFRALVNARHGRLDTAKSDIEFLTRLKPDNPAYKALSIYVSALSDEQMLPEAVGSQPVTDVRALSLLGQAAYLRGDYNVAQDWWAAEARIDSTEATLSFLAGKKHLNEGERRVAAALLAECVAVTPNTKEAREANDLLPQSNNSNNH